MLVHAWKKGRKEGKKEGGLALAAWSNRLSFFWQSQACEKVIKGGSALLYWESHAGQEI